jgi:hypothetical protein
MVVRGALHLVIPHLDLLFFTDLSFLDLSITDQLSKQCLPESSAKEWSPAVDVSPHFAALLTFIPYAKCESGETLPSV